VKVVRKYETGRPAWGVGQSARGLGGGGGGEGDGGSGGRWDKGGKGERDGGVWRRKGRLGYWREEAKYMLRKMKENLFP